MSSGAAQKLVCAASLLHWGHVHEQVQQLPRAMSSTCCRDGLGRQGGRVNQRGWGMPGFQMSSQMCGSAHATLEVNASQTQTFAIKTDNDYC